MVFPYLTVKNRIFPSSIAGQLDNYGGSGTGAYHLLLAIVAIFMFAFAMR
jgi:hypothetical protein